MSQVALIATLAPRTLFIWLQLVNSKFCLRFPVHLESEDWYTRSNWSSIVSGSSTKGYLHLVQWSGISHHRVLSTRWSRSYWMSLELKGKVTNWRANFCYYVSRYKAGKCRIHQLLQQGRSSTHCSPHKIYCYHCLWSPKRGIDFVSARKHTTPQWSKDLLPW